MQRAGHLLTVVFSDTLRKAHFWSSVDNVNVKQQNLAISFKVATENLLLIYNTENK